MQQLRLIGNDYLEGSAKKLLLDNTLYLVSDVSHV